MAKSISNIPILKITPNSNLRQEDQLAVEAPLEIQIEYGHYENRQRKSISVTMRTPGDDKALSLGFLFTEGIIETISQIKKIFHPTAAHPDAQENVIVVALEKDVEIDFKKLERHFYTSSSCGVCGKTSIEAVQTLRPQSLADQRLKVDAKIIHSLPDTLLKRQSVFAHTGGIHAAALFDHSGKLHLLCEDVGRHNAVDKLIGTALQQSHFSRSEKIILVSGRVSFELVQKALIAGFPILAAVGAPSSLSIELAQASGMTVLGFVRDQRFNIYSHSERIFF